MAHLAIDRFDHGMGLVSYPDGLSEILRREGRHGVKGVVPAFFPHREDRRARIAGLHDKLAVSIAVGLLPV